MTHDMNPGEAVWEKSIKPKNAGQVPAAMSALCQSAYYIIPKWLLPAMESY